MPTTPLLQVRDQPPAPETPRPAEPDAGAAEPGATTPPSTESAVGAAPLSSLAGRPVLVAVDGSRSSEPVARVALALAEERGAHVHVLSVVDTRSAPIPPPLDLALALADGTYGEAIHAEQKHDLRLALSAALQRPVDWPVEVSLGAPAHAIVYEARRIGAALIVLGLRHHGAVERAINDETTLHVMRTAPCPVLGVTPSLAGLPRRVLVGVDFSRASLTAARAAKAVVADGGTLVLAYAPLSEAFEPDDGERVIHDLGVAAAFIWFTGELDVGPRVKVEDVVLERDAGRSIADLLLARADGTGADMIAVGSVRHGRVERWMLGSVTTDVARDGSHALLAVPPGDPGAP